MSGGKLRSDQFICPEKPKMVKKIPNNLHGCVFSKIIKFV